MTLYNVHVGLHYRVRTEFVRLSRMKISKKLRHDVTCRVLTSYTSIIVISVDLFSADDRGSEIFDQQQR